MNEAPLYARVRAALEERIRDSSWPAETQLPSEPQLAEEFNVSRMTLRQAIEKLVEAGLLYRRRGVGTFVAPVFMQRDLARLASFSEDARGRGVAPGSRVLSAAVEPASDEVGKRLGLAVGALVVAIERVRLYGTMPVALQRLWIPEAMCPELADPALASGSIYEHFETVRKFRLGWGGQNISARLPTAAERRLLELPARIVLLVVERTTFLDEGTAIEFSRAYYRSDEQSFSITLRR